MTRRIVSLFDKMISGMAAYGAGRTCSQDLRRMRVLFDSVSQYQPDDQFHITRIPVRFQ